MNPSYWGDSYDVVKRFFCAELTALGYSVFARPMFTGEWDGAQQEFLRFIGALAEPDQPARCTQAALFVDPDTGVHRKATSQHVAIGDLCHEASAYRLVFAFDQSFSRSEKSTSAMRGKLDDLTAHGCQAMYYDSHARFLFVSRESAPLVDLRRHLVGLGMPDRRFIGGYA